MQHSNVLRLVVLLAAFAAGAAAQRSRYSIEQGASAPGVLCWKDSAGAELCFTIPTGALAAGAQTWKWPVQDIGGGGCWVTDGSYNVTVGACGAGGGSSSGAATLIQLSDGSGGFTSAAGLAFSTRLEIPAQADGAGEGGELVLAGTSGFPGGYTFDQYAADVRLFAHDAGARRFQLFNTGGGTLDLALAATGALSMPDGVGTFIDMLSLSGSSLIVGPNGNPSSPMSVVLTSGASGASRVSVKLTHSAGTAGWLAPDTGYSIGLGSSSAPWLNAHALGSITAYDNGLFDQAVIRLEDTGNSNHFVELGGFAGTMAATYRLRFPGTAPALGQILYRGVSGELEWREGPPWLSQANTFTASNSFSAGVNALKVNAAGTNNAALWVKPYSTTLDGVRIDANAGQFFGSLFHVTGTSSYFDVSYSGQVTFDGVLAPGGAGAAIGTSGNRLPKAWLTDLDVSGSATIAIGAGTFRGKMQAASSGSLSCSGLDGWWGVTTDNYFVVCRDTGTPVRLRMALSVY